MRLRAIATSVLLVALVLAFATSAAAFTQPQQLRSKHGVLRATFVAKLGEATIAGKRVSGAMTINGQFPGPTLNVHPGDTIKLKFVNQLGEDTNIHFHGLHVSPAGHADNILRDFRPGKTYDVEVKIPKDHPNGLFWYHPHLHGAVNSQVLRGYAGMISIAGGRERVRSLARFRQRQIGLNLTQFDASGSAIVNPANENDATATTTVNGQVGQTITMRPGSTELWRIANMSNEGFYKLNLEGHKMWIVGQDGNPTRVAQAVDEFVIPPGSRFEVLVQAGKSGSYDFRQLFFSDGFNSFPRQSLLTLNVAGAKARSAPIPRHIKSFDDLSHAKVGVRRRWVLSFSEASDPVFKAYINGKTFNPSRVDTRAKLGQVEEWTFINNTTQDHPIHLHTNDFQLVAVNGKRVRPVAPIDNTILPRSGSITFRFKPLDYTGLTVFHCHILFHEDSGMMATIRYIRDGASTSVVRPAGYDSVHDEAVETAAALDPETTGGLVAAEHHPPSDPHLTRIAARARPEPGAPVRAGANDWLFCRLGV